MLQRDSGLLPLRLPEEESFLRGDRPRRAGGLQRHSRPGANRGLAASPHATLQEGDEHSLRNRLREAPIGTLGQDPRHLHRQHQTRGLHSRRHEAGRSGQPERHLLHRQQQAGDGPDPQAAHDPGKAPDTLRPGPPRRAQHREIPAHQDGPLNL